MRKFPLSPAQEAVALRSADGAFLSRRAVLATAAAGGAFTCSRLGARRYVRQSGRAAARRDQQHPGRAQRSRPRQSDAAIAVPECNQSARDGRRRRVRRRQRIRIQHVLWIFQGKEPGPLAADQAAVASGGVPPNPFTFSLAGVTPHYSNRSGNVKVADSRTFKVSTIAAALETIKPGGIRDDASVVAQFPSKPPGFMPA